MAIRFYIQAERVKGKAAPDDVYYREWYQFNKRQSGHVDDDIRKEHATHYRAWKQELSENEEMLKQAALEGLEEWEKNGGPDKEQLKVDPQLREITAPDLNKKEDANMEVDIHDGKLSLSKDDAINAKTEVKEASPKKEEGKKSSRSK